MTMATPGAREGAANGGKVLGAPSRPTTNRMHQKGTDQVVQGTVASLSFNLMAGSGELLYGEARRARGQAHELYEVSLAALDCVHAQRLVVSEAGHPQPAPGQQ
jgi:hypothetical protein